jgi:hypothetical protein
MHKEFPNPKAQSGLRENTMSQLNSTKLKTPKTLALVKLQLQRVFTDWGMEVILKSQGK